IIQDNAKEGLVRVMNPETEKYGFVDLKGNIKVPLIFDRTRDFSEGVCVVYNEVHPNYLSIKNTFAYIDTKGNKIIPEVFNYCTSQVLLSLYDEKDFIDGYAIVHHIKNGIIHATFIGKNGNPLNGFDWENKDISRFSCGLAAFEDHMNKKGFYNSKGEKVVSAKYDYVQDFKDEIAVVAKEINGKLLHGCINTEGVEIIPLIYDNIEDFENGVALATLNGKMGLIDRYGNSSFREK
ncbi:MAG: WG repeat-containing protein, partial [Allobaculum sp.]|nr:WG repeat-containing protein [Allobaculum sp.]